MKRIISLPDIHEPYNIPLKPVLDFCDDFNPHVINYLGDTTSAESCNHWKENKNIRKDVECVIEDQNALRRNVLIPFKRAAPKRCKKNYFIGNHEWWFYKAMMQDLKSKHLYDLERNLADLKMNFVPFNGVINYGFLHFMHGIYTNKYHSNKIVTNYRKCILYGHTHDIQSHMLHSPIDTKEKLLAKSIGCLCKLNPIYLYDKPNQWVNAFNYAYVRNDGTFNEYTVVITEGRFIVNGKEYK